MAGLCDMERLRAKNLSLLQELQKGQRSLRASVRSAVVNRGSPFKKPEPTVLQDKPAGLNTQFQRDPLSRTRMSTIRNKGKNKAPKVRLTSTPKYVGSPISSGSGPLQDPFSPHPPVGCVQTDIPNSLYESFLTESNSAFGRGGNRKSPTTADVTQSLRKTPSTRGKNIRARSAGMKKKGLTPRSPKPQPETSISVFTPSPSSKGPERPYSVQLETSSMLPAPISDKENRGQGSRYGYRRPLDLAHEESYYQLNKESPLHSGEPPLGRGFAGQLLADGNSRQQAKMSQEVTARPKSILLTPGARLSKSRNRVSFHHSPNASMTAAADDSIVNRTQPLLGYDWIAGLLDADLQANEHSEMFFDELRQFRQANREECVHKSLTENPDISASFQDPGSSLDDDEGITESGRHTCIHNYTLNQRLFAVPLHGTQHGESLCAICNDRRKPKQPGTTSPSYIRVSIPRSTLASPYRIRPHRRKSYDPTDSVGLSQHCLAGWETSKPSMLPTASNVDLKDSVDVMASNALNLMAYPTREPSYQAEKASRISRHTQDLLNRSHALGLDLQRLERVGMSVAQLPPGPHSTSYPVL